MVGEVPDGLEVTVEELARSSEAGDVLLVDVREPWEFAAARVPGARLVPMASVPDRLEELRSAGTRVHVVCASGYRSLRVAQWLAGHGVDAVSVAGGTVAWQATGRPVDVGDA